VPQVLPARMGQRLLVARARRGFILAPRELNQGFAERARAMRRQGDTLMTIKVGDRVPDATFTVMTAEGPKPMTSAEVFGGKKVALFAVPGAFTPTCSAKHLPGYVNNFDALKAKGVDRVACIAVNDVFVMSAWGKDQKVGDKVLMLADGNGDFTRAAGLELDAKGFGMGQRSQRYSMLVDNGVVKELNVEEGGQFKVSAAEHLLGQL
jgi:glutaredoxin/glutathione-dependent peroxiredoxin